MLALFALLLAVVLGIIIVGLVIKSVIGLALMLLLAGLFGALASSVLSYRGSFLFSIGAGLIGAVLGTIFANILGVAKGPTLFHLPLLWTIVGSFAAVGVAKVAGGGDGRRALSRGDRRLLG